jgi:hypothetical protein
MSRLHRSFTQPPRTGKNIDAVDLADYYWSNFTGVVRFL